MHTVISMLIHANTHTLSGRSFLSTARREVKPGLSHRGGVRTRVELEDCESRNNEVGPYKLKVQLTAGEHAFNSTGMCWGGRGLVYSQERVTTNSTLFGLGYYFALVYLNTLSYINSNSEQRD